MGKGRVVVWGEGCMCGVDEPSDANGKGSLGPVAPLGDGHLAAEVAARSVEDLVRVAVLLGVEAAIVGVRGTVVGV